MENSDTNKGKIVQVIGAVVDAEFPPGSTPEITRTRSHLQTFKF